MYISENVGLAGNKATLYEQAGFSLAVVVVRTVTTSCYVALILRLGLNKATSKQPPLAATKLVSA